MLIHKQTPLWSVLRIKIERPPLNTPRVRTCSDLPAKGLGWFSSPKEIFSGRNVTREFRNI
uniref:Uncharacterized protein n=1 Tax=Romanomermis culicivorax TaxID=13658 RepID=A0A915JV57_ROMCU